MLDVTVNVPYKRGDWTRNGFIGNRRNHSLISKLEIYISSTKDAFYIQPINSSGSITSAKLRLPCDVEMLTSLIDTLDKVRREIAANGGDTSG